MMQPLFQPFQPTHGMDEDSDGDMGQASHSQAGPTGPSHDFMETDDGCHTPGAEEAAAGSEEAKKALDRAVGVLLQTWTDRGDLSRAPDDAEQGLGWDVASLRQLVRTDEAVEAAWRVFCPSGEPQPNDAFSQIVKKRVNSTLGVEQVQAFKVGKNTGPLLGHLASCTSTVAKVWPNVVVSDALRAELPEAAQREQTRRAERAQPAEDEGARKEAAEEGAAEPVAAEQPAAPPPSLDGLSCLAEVAERSLPATPHRGQKRTRTQAVRYTPPASPSARESREIHTWLYLVIWLYPQLWVVGMGLCRAAQRREALWS
uniref:Uncharacterized protein n=1 Tax=Haptolina ericina TaxID=156174 RepID=A0A7S3AR25_9EUKA|mmetsp:Transcript_31151/g.70407  ORF Transcript_31151/g.70407 Transcript_31151/m.70407 type:complete len:315 (+) Transcript_31151:172-1116(+)